MDTSPPLIAQGYLDLLITPDHYIGFHLDWFWVNMIPKDHVTLHGSVILSDQQAQLIHEHDMSGRDYRAILHVNLLESKNHGSEDFVINGFQVKVSVNITAQAAGFEILRKVVAIFHGISTTLNIRRLTAGQPDTASE